MKIAIIGSRNLSVDNIGEFISQNVTEIVSGGAKGIDSDAATYAMKHDIKLTEFLPDYARYKRGAPLKRNEQIAKYADECLAFWDGRSKGTMHTVTLFEHLGKKTTVIKLTKQASK